MNLLYQASTPTKPHSEAPLLALRPLLDISVDRKLSPKHVRLTLTCELDHTLFFDFLRLNLDIVLTNAKFESGQVGPLHLLQN